MILLQGKGVNNEIAIGKLWFFQRTQIDVSYRAVDNTIREQQRFEEARLMALEQLKKLYKKSLSETGEEQAAIFDIHQMMLDDLDYREAIQGKITGEHANAEFAIHETAQEFIQMFLDTGDNYMMERAADVKDISGRLLRIISGQERSSLESLDEPVIVVADDLTPSETLQMDKSKVLGFVTQRSAANSHTAILARSMSIPAIVGVGDQISIEHNGKGAILDGENAIIYIEPDVATLKHFLRKQEEQTTQKELLQKLKGQPTQTKKGQKINLYANVGGLDDIQLALENDAEGVGLFRSEFLYLGRKEYPTVEEQFQIYKKAVELLNGKELVIRTLDIGADKKIDYFDLPEEENPALGFRAIRICLSRPEVFKTQLQAILRASAHGKIAIMFPMITSVKEIVLCKAMVQQVKEELQAKGIAYDNQIKLGIMIETPAAAIMSDELAKEVDFFSIGTNDLSQYTMAIDRQNALLDCYYDAHHPAVLRLIKMTVKNGHKAGIWVGICGELGADLGLTQDFLKMEVDELSVSPSAVLSVRKNVMEAD